MGNEDEHDDQPQEPGGQGGNGNGNGQGNGNGNGRKGEPLEVELSRQPSYLADMHALRRNRSLRMLVGGDLHNHQRAMRWFSENWPVDADWPEGVERPVAEAAE